MSAIHSRFTVLLAAILMTLAAARLAAGQATSAALAAAAVDRLAAGSTEDEGVVRGVVIDASDGVLPGVVVLITSADGRTIGSTVTDSEGSFAFEGLPWGQIDLSFQLHGFDPSTARVTLDNGSSAEARLVHRMALSALNETVTVRGDPPPPPPPPRPVLLPVPVHDQASVCGPAMAEGPQPSLGTVRSRHDDETKVLFATGDQLLIDGDTDNGLAVGQNLVVRRRYPTAMRYGRNVPVMGEHSSGLVQIVNAESRTATAVVVYACDEIMRGDHLALFEPEPVREPGPAGSPDFDRASRILFADEGQPVGVTGRMMVIEGGNVRVGQRLTLFRRSRFRDGRPLVIGDAIVVAVRRTSATILVERATDIIAFGERGDWAAPQEPQTTSRH